MSMPLPIHVALVASTAAQVKEASKCFRLSAPGIGAAYLSAIDAVPNEKISSPTELPPGRIKLWICLDQASFEIAKQLHDRDRRNSRYSRGFYDELLPEACVLIDNTIAAPERKNLLSNWAQRVTDAWYETS